MFRVRAEPPRRAPFPGAAVAAAATTSAPSGDVINISIFPVPLLPFPPVLPGPLAVFQRAANGFHQVCRSFEVRAKRATLLRPHVFS